MQHMRMVHRNEMFKMRLLYASEGTFENCAMPTWEMAMKKTKSKPLMSERFFWELLFSELDRRMAFDKKLYKDSKYQRYFVNRAKYPKGMGDV